MRLKPQDILISLKLLDPRSQSITFAELAGELGMSASETHQAFHRARESGLIAPLNRQPNQSAVAELLIHGIKYMVPVSPGKRTRGIVTGYAAPPLVEHFSTSENDVDLLVWPDPNGTCAGSEIEPLFRSSPAAARRDHQLYEWLVLADVLRGAGRARERKIAENIVRQRLEALAVR